MKRSQNALGINALSKLAVAGLALIAAPALADDVKLFSSDGTVNIVGEFVDFTENSYVILTALGELRVSAARVRCEGAACPVFETDDADVKFAGSETIAQGIIPLLLEGYAAFLGAETTITETTNAGEIISRMVSEGGLGEEIGSFLVSSSATDEGFSAMLDGTADIGMSARRIDPEEARALRNAGFGNMVSPTQEHIIAVDSIVAITHPDNKVNTMSTEDLAKIYAGEITNWSEVGGEDLPINVFGRAAGTAAAEIFSDHIFGDANAVITPTMVVADDSTRLATMVNEDPAAIGFVPYAAQRGAKPLSLVNACGLTMTPDAFYARTEEYALEHRMYLYNAEAVSEEGRAFLDYVLSADADEIILKSGFVGFGVDRRAQPLDGHRARALLEPKADVYEGSAMREMLGMMVDYERLSTTFRFRTGSSRLDEQATIDMKRLKTYLEGEPAGTRLMFVGFTDDVGEFGNNRPLSKKRAKQVMEEFQAYAGETLADIEMAADGFGEIAPSACNTTDDGRRINRRVEVWIQPPA